MLMMEPQRIMLCESGTAFSAFRLESETRRGTNIPPPPVPAAAASAEAKKMQKVQRASQGSVTARSHALASLSLQKRPCLPAKFELLQTCREGHSLSSMQWRQMLWRQTSSRPHSAWAFLLTSQCAPRRP